MALHVGDGSFATELGRPRDVRLSPNSGGIADITVLRVCAKGGSRGKRDRLAIRDFVVLCDCPP